MGAMAIHASPNSIVVKFTLCVKGVAAGFQTALGCDEAQEHLQRFNCEGYLKWHPSELVQLICIYSWSWCLHRFPGQDQMPSFV